MLQRSLGISVIASTPVLSSFQNDAASFASPGKRHPIPIIAMGSLTCPSADLWSMDISNSLVQQSEFQQSNDSPHDVVFHYKLTPRKATMFWSFYCSQGVMITAS